MAIIVPTIGTEIDVVDFGKPVADGVNANTAYLAALDAAWVSFTPVLATSGGTPGAGPIGGRYKKLGAHTCTFTMTWTWGTGAYGGSGEYRWNLPVAASSAISDYAAIGGAHLAWGTAITPPRKIATVHKVGNTFMIFFDYGQLTAGNPQGVQIGDGYFVYATYETA